MSKTPINVRASSQVGHADDADPAMARDNQLDLRAATCPRRFTNMGGFAQRRQHDETGVLPLGGLQRHPVYADIEGHPEERNVRLPRRAPIFTSTLKVLALPRPPSAKRWGNACRGG